VKKNVQGFGWKAVVTQSAMSCIDDDVIAAIYPPGAISVSEDQKKAWLSEAESKAGSGRSGNAYVLAGIISRYKIDNRKRPK
jgi:hypothetical protein